MINALQSDIGVNVIASIIASLFFLVTGFVWGKYKERRRKFGRNLDEYDFYPFTVTRENFGEFNLNNFRLGMHYFLKNHDYTAARQLIFIGEQNNVRNQLEPADDPAHSLIVLENNVTGRHLRDGTTNLLIDLKKRQLQNEDKLNYELNIGSRRFKCTTIPIIRKEFGVVGAICINIDANYLTEEVLRDRERIEAWFKNFLRVDMQVDENILSKDEYAKALKGKRHFKDETV